MKDKMEAKIDHYRPVTTPEKDMERHKKAFPSCPYCASDGEITKLTDDGYPTEEFLERIRTWEVKRRADCKALLEFIRAGGWYYPEFFSPADWSRKGVWMVSTGGWSGNESVIDAMEDNHMFWLLSWASSRRGGHYMFDVRSG